MLYISLSTLATLIALWIARFSWQRRHAPGEFYCALLMMAIAIWTCASAGEFAAITVSAKIAWSKFSYVGIISAPPLWLLFALSYGQRTKWLTRWQILALWGIPVLTLGLVATNEWHGLVWPSITPVSNEPGAPLLYGHGSGFWLHAVYFVFLLLRNPGLRLQRSRQNTGRF